MASGFLLEIGTEEIPSGYLGDALKALKERTQTYLKENRIDVSGELSVYGTPRRLLLVGSGVSDKQADMEQEVTGPPEKAAFDDNGNPTKAAVGFAKKQGVSVEALETIETPKGKYLYVKRTIPGQPLLDVLADIFPKLISDIPWPKSMRWGDIGFSFVRPIHWILALLNGEVVPFDVAGVRSGNQTRGHRFMSAGIDPIQGIEDYFEKMREAHVLIDQDERKNKVEQLVKEAAETVSGIAAVDPELLDTVTNLVEFPSAVCGGFDEAFLDLPDPVLITPMREHQKYFPVRDSDGRLMSHFVAVNNTIAKEASVVRKGHERVLRARLKDADFFFKEDRKRPLEDRLEDLKSVIYQAELGTSYDKMARFTQLAEYLAEQVAPEKKADAALTARLCKCDLVTEMVMEFPSLQGVMGMTYARLDGHPEDVCLGIHEHYLPVRAEGDLPASEVGAMVGMADRMDTVTGCFAIGQEPTGTADPFALRRHALAVLRILEDRKWSISLKDFAARSLAILGEELHFDRDRVFRKVFEFFRERYKNMMLRSGYENDLTEAVLSTGFDRVDQLREKIRQLKGFAEASSEFEPLALTFKRVTNILKKEDREHPVNPELFSEPCERNLWQSYLGLRDEVNALAEAGQYEEALQLMAGLRKPVDDLFDGVEVLTKSDADLRNNRVGLLQALSDLFLSVADLSKFSI